MELLKLIWAKFCDDRPKCRLNKKTMKTRTRDIHYDLLTNMNKVDLDCLLSLASKQFNLDKDVLMMMFLKYKLSIVMVNDFYIDDARFMILRLRTIEYKIYDENGEVNNAHYDHHKGIKYGE